MINNIQALRAFAALNVVLYHVITVGDSYGYRSPLFAHLTKWGANGVDIFFVISGFIMVYIQHVEPRSPAEFLENRIKRIVPLYWSITLAFALLLLVAPALSRHVAVGFKHTALSLLFVSQASGYDYPLLVPGWTLEFEMLFYVLFALSIFVSRVPRLVILALALGAAILLFGTNVIVLEFVFGMIAGRLYLAGWGRGLGFVLAAIGCAGLAASIVWSFDQNRVLVWGVPSFFLVLGCSWLPQLRHGVLVFLGAASYSIYLVHTLAIPVLFKAAKAIGAPAAGWGALATMLLTFVLAALVGVALHRYYERPLARRLR